MICASPLECPCGALVLQVVLSALGIFVLRGALVILLQVATVGTTLHWVAIVAIIMSADVVVELVVGVATVKFKVAVRAGFLVVAGVADFVAGAAHGAALFHEGLFHKVNENDPSGRVAVQLAPQSCTTVADMSF